jgi:hypothetical protein
LLGVALFIVTPVEKLPVAAWQALGLGFVSAVFDNIPLTALALKQGGYDWGYLAYAVGFGGSMILVRLIRRRRAGRKSSSANGSHGWHVAVAYVVGFFFMLTVLGWHPDPDHWQRASNAQVMTTDAAGSITEPAHRRDACER